VHDLTETIVAVATPAGRGGVGCVRLSGPRAAEISARMFRPASPTASDGPGLARFGRFVGASGGALDAGYRVRFEPPRSFTGEPVAELWSHGSPAVLAGLVEAALTHGAVAAAPGEFTYRAFRNGRIDLAEAEAIRDLVEARTTYQARVALSQAEGALSRHLAPLRERLEDLVVRGEAAVEFVDESETQVAPDAFVQPIDAVRRECLALAAEYRFGRIVRRGARLTLIGLPNAGKSSLFNRLLVRERAIVTDVPGTTRDTIEEGLDLDGIPVTLVDTAGLREATDDVEREGVARAERARREADVVLLVLDGSRPLADAEREALRQADERTVVVVNKCDLEASLRHAVPNGGLRVSARTGEGCGALRSRLREILAAGAPLEDPVVTHERHAEALRRAASSLERASTGAAAGLPEDLVLEDLRAAIAHLGEITGEFGTEDLYDRIFSTFCIGK